MAMSNSALVSYKEDKTDEAINHKRKLEEGEPSQPAQNKRQKISAPETKAVEIDFSSIMPSPAKNEFGFQFAPNCQFKTLNQRFFFARKRKEAPAQTLDQRFSKKM